MAEVARRGSLRGHRRACPRPRARSSRPRTRSTRSGTCATRPPSRSTPTTACRRRSTCPESATEDDVAAAYRHGVGPGLPRHHRLPRRLQGRPGAQRGRCGADGAAARRRRQRGVKPRPHSLTGATLPDGDADRHRVHHRQRQRRRRALRGLRAGGQGGLRHHGGGGGARPAGLARAPAAVAALAAAAARGGDQPALAHRRRPAHRLRRGQGPVAARRARADARPSTSGRRGATPAPARRAAPASRLRRVGDLCSECGQATLVYEEGCKKCLSCGFNEC